MDKNIRGLERERSAGGDPEDFPRLIHGLARGMGPGVYLELLRDANLWRATPREIQDLAGDEVARRLGDSWKRLPARHFLCRNRNGPIQCLGCMGTGLLMRGLFERVPCADCQGAGAFIENRIIVFETLQEAEFSLIPGASTGELPLLVARWPMTYAMLGSSVNAPRRDFPMVNVDREGIENSLEHYGLRLPTPREWLHACRAGTDTTYYWGHGVDDSHVWHRGNADGVPQNPYIHDAARKWNAFGLVDMIGNVAELLAGDGDFAAYLSANDVPEAFHIMAKREFAYNREAVRPDCLGFRPVADLPT